MACASLLVGCDSAQRRRPSLGSSADPATLRQVYPQANLDRARTVADFQNPEQTDWFALTPNATQAAGAAPTLALPAGAQGTAERVLSVPFARVSDILHLNVAEALPGEAGDWREFGALLMSIYADRDETRVTFGLHSGVVDAPRWQQVFTLDAGWNHLRVDLEDIGRHVDLRRVRRLSWTPSGPHPLRLQFDNMVLADRLRWLVPQSDAAENLFAFSHGPRVHVGAGDRFELIFEGGQIQAWHADLPGSLAADSGLGPWPVSLPPGWESAPQRFVADEYSSPLDASQEVLEASPFRVVVAGRQRFASHDIYRQSSVYADGRVFVQFRLERWEGVAGANVGFLVRLNGQAGFLAPPRLPDSPDAFSPDFALLARTPTAQPDLLWSRAQPAPGQHVRSVRRRGMRELNVLLGDFAPATGRTAQLLCFWPPDLNQADDAAWIAADYQRPAELALTVGRLVLDEPGDLNQDGFNESHGTYELATQNGRAVAELRPRGQRRCRPVFRVRGTEGRRCWIYVNGAALDSFGRDAAGRLLFRLPATIMTPRTIEVHTSVPAVGDADQ